MKQRVTRSISKSLSKNDTGETGAHQVGILVPKQPEILSFFPKLAATVKNPRTLIRFKDDGGTHWEFPFIYYNNKLYGGTRNEYRLTRMTGFIRAHNLKPGDELILSRDEYDQFQVSFKRAHVPQRVGGGILRLGSEWKVIRMRGEE
jgi:Restriction endonuclease EcoRII, N-terminal